MVKYENCQGVEVELKQKGGEFYIFDNYNNIVRLKSYQTEKKKKLKSTYFLFLRSFECDSPIKSLKFILPEKFKATLKKEKMTFCKANVGGFTSKSKCLNDVNTNIIISDDKKSIEIVPDELITLDDEDYALTIKLFNPVKKGNYPIQLIGEMHTGEKYSIGWYNLKIE